MEFLTNDKLTIVGAAGMIGSNMAQTAIMMHLTPNLCLYDPYAPGLEGVAEELFHCGFEGMNITFTSDIKEALTGAKYVVHAHLDDESYRIVASAKVDRYLSKEKAAYESGQEVDILIWQKTDLGFKAIINDEYSGLLYESEIFQPLHTGMRMKAYVKQVREDGKIDLLLQKPGQAKVEDFSATLLDYIREQGGRIALNDKSPAEEIYATFGVSKKTFKKAVGDLYKKHLVVLEEDGIRIRY